ncbi:MAG: hypothetical protein E7637_09220 [Ruminococcaceae bacterium]|nr:hypothetical protein [Oscillospiraceae bacterium]
MVGFILYVLKLLFLTLGVFVLCGFAVRLCARLFSHLTGYGSGRVFDVTSVIGTPIHELGHALMCPLFAHKITKIQLWSPRAKNGVYGFVEHTYNPKNPWARLGNLFIGLGPIFSGLGVVVLSLWLCFSAQWSTYLGTSRALVEAGAAPSALLKEAFALLSSLPSAYSATPIRATLGILIILAVSLHISLSASDVKGSLGAFPVYLLMLLVFAGATFFAKVDSATVAALKLWNLRLLSLFCVVIAFAAVWVLIALTVKLIRSLIRCF